MRHNFRYFDVFTNKMYQVSSLYFGDRETVIVQLQLDSSSTRKIKINSNDKEKEQLLTSIGKKDINEKEIYEGDIVKGVAKIKNEEFHFIGKVEWDDQELCYFFESNDDFRPYIKAHFVVQVEIIGNIYQNKELWEG